MKTLLLITGITLLSFAAKAQINPIDSTTKKISYSEVVTVSDVKKDELYLRAKEWIAKTFKSANSVIQMDDKEAGKIIGKGGFKSSFNYMISPIDFTGYFTVSITVKDGKYRYEFSDFSVKDNFKDGYENINLDDANNTGKVEVTTIKNGKGEYKSRFKGYFEKTDLVTKNMVADLKNAMSVKSKDDF